MKKIYEVSIIGINKPIDFIIADNIEDMYLVFEKRGHSLSCNDVQEISYAAFTFYKHTYKIEINRLARLLEIIIQAEMEVLNV